MRNSTNHQHQMKLFLKRNSSTFFVFAEAAGIIATAVLAAMETPKALEKLKEKKKEERRELSRWEIVITVAPNYIPSAVVGVSTIACAFGSNAISKHRQASLISAYNVLNKSYKDYREKLIELHGKEADEEIRDELVRTCCNYHQIGMDVPDDKLIFFEEISGETIVCYEKEIMDAEYHLNRNFALRGYASLNEFYEFLGIPKTDYGDSVGWSSWEGYYWIDFEHHLVSNEDDGGAPIYEICYVISPDADYLTSPDDYYTDDDDEEE